MSVVVAKCRAKCRDSRMIGAEKRHFILGWGGKTKTDREAKKVKKAQTKQSKPHITN